MFDRSVENIPNDKFRCSSAADGLPGNGDHDNDDDDDDDDYNNF